MALPPDTDAQDVIRYLDEALPELARRGAYETASLMQLARDMILSLVDELDAAEATR